MRKFMHWFSAAIVAAVLVLPSSSLAQSGGPTFRSPTDDELTQTKNPGANWITYGGALNNQRYSTLDQINTGNASTLRGAWLTRLGSARGSKYIFEADPLVIDGVMYIPTGNDDIFALDGKSGRKLWEYNSDIPQVNDLICCGWDNRGVAAGQGMIFTGQLDGSFAAIDQTDRQAHVADAARGLPRRLQHHRRDPLLRRHRLHAACPARKTAFAAAYTRWTPRRAKRSGASTPFPAPATSAAIPGRQPATRTRSSATPTCTAEPPCGRRQPSTLSWA